MDSNNILPVNFKPEIILLTQSPRINLQRYLESNTPQLIIADGSNYHQLYKTVGKKHANKKKSLFTIPEKRELTILWRVINVLCHQFFYQRVTSVKQ